MRRWGLYVLVLAACYEAPTSDGACSITCTQGVADSCPGDLACEAGFCVSPGQVCRPSFAKVAAATGFACALDEASALWCWGSHPQTTLATRVDTSRRWTALDGGGGQMCGLADGLLFCWGENDDREVSGTVVGDVAEPLEIAATGVTEWTAVSAGSGYTCAIGSGQLFCWGLNSSGQLGDGSTTDRGAPMPVMAPITDWVDVATSERHTCATSASMGVYCWGRADRGENGTSGTSAIPVSITLAGAPLMATRVAVTSEASCAITPTQELYCWGYHFYGQLGDRRTAGDPATVVMSSEPLKGSDLVGWTDISAGGRHTCGIVGGAVHCWGFAEAGGLGNGYWSDSRSFNLVVPSGARSIGVAWPRNALTGLDELDLVCAVVNEDVQCWGDNRFGQLGTGGATLVTTPSEVAGGRTWRTLSAGTQHTCGIADDNALYCWGSTINGQASGFVYGGGSPRTACAVNASDPTQPLCDIGAPRLLGYVTDPIAVTTGSAHTCALANGVVSCWGSGMGGSALKRDVPQPGGQMWKALLQTGRDGQCGIAMNASNPVYCFGNVIAAPTSTPMRTAQLDGFMGLALGGPNNFGVFLDTAGMLHGFGDNTRYQLGDGTTTNYASVMPVANRTYGYSAIATRTNESGRGEGNFACGIRADNQRVECWGASTYGQTGTIVSPTTVPNEVTGLDSCTAVATGSDHACAICSSTISCWGDNRSGQLAAPPDDMPAAVPRTVNVAVDGDPWVQLVAGARFTCARTMAGRAFCWGTGEHGSLGVGATGANLPVTVRASQID